MTRTMLIIAFVVGFLALSVGAYEMWRSDLDAQARLKATLASDDRNIADANTRISQREQSLQIALEQIARLKRKTRTPDEIVKELPKYLPLPYPITPLQSTKLGGPGNQAVLPHEGTADYVASASAREPTVSPVESIPAADLKPLFDFLQDCRSCNLAAENAKEDRADNLKQIAAIRAERDAAVSVAKGGPFLKRLRRNAEWLFAGAVIGYVTAER